MNKQPEQSVTEDKKGEAHPQGSDPTPDGNRRDAIRRIGKYSAYAVPALLALTSMPAAASV